MSKKLTVLLVTHDLREADRPPFVPVSKKSSTVTLKIARPSAARLSPAGDSHDFVACLNVPHTKAVTAALFFSLSMRRIVYQTCSGSTVNP